MGIQKTKMKKLLFLLTFLCTLMSLNGLYFHLFKGESKCFYDEYYTDTVLLIRYELISKTAFNFSQKNENRVDIKVYHNDDSDENDPYKADLVKNFYSDKIKGKFSIVLEKQGHYKVCLESKDKEIYKDEKVKVSLILDTDQDDLDDSENLAEVKDFATVEKRMKKIQKKTGQIEKMQDHQLVSEDQF